MAIIDLDVVVNFTGNNQEFETTSKKVKQELDEITAAAERVGQVFSDSMQRAITDGKSFEQTLKNIALQISNIALNQALKPVEDAAASLAKQIFGGLLQGQTGGQSGGQGGNSGATAPTQSGGARPAPQVNQSARLAGGGVIQSPALFSSAGRLGMLAEAGPEAVLPLRRGTDGRLGVQASAAAAAAAPVQVTFNISTPDVEGFRKSQAQIASMLTRTVNRGRRNL